MVRENIVITSENYILAKWIEISAKDIFPLWEKTKHTHFIEIDCPYCHSLTFIWFKTKTSKLHLKCHCEIPPRPTPKTFRIKLSKLS